MRGTRSLTVLAALAALGLASCGDRTAGDVCKPFTTANAQPSAVTQPGEVAPSAPDASAGLDDCLHRWGYTLAASTEPAAVVAEATLAACSQALASWNQQALAAAERSNIPVQAPSIMTGQATNALAEHHAFASGRALFYVVQARAGHCKPPPAPSGGAPARS